MWHIFVSVFNYVWGPIAAVITWIALNHIWPSIQKWISLKDEISTIYTQYGNIRVKWHEESHTEEFGTDQFGQKIVGPTVLLRVIDNQPQLDAAAQHKRKLAGRLRALKDSTLGYDILAAIHLLPSQKILMQVSKDLIGWSNDIDSPLWGRSSDFIHRRRDSIKKELELIGE